MKVTLERQYKLYLNTNPEIVLSFEDWEKVYMENLRIGLEMGDDFSDWDITLMDGIEELD